MLSRHSVEVRDKQCKIEIELPTKIPKSNKLLFTGRLFDNVTYGTMIQTPAFKIRYVFLHDARQRRRGQVLVGIPQLPVQAQSRTVCRAQDHLMHLLRHLL